jgi:hypothetical protein
MSSDSPSPSFVVKAQYIKDLSFENPHAPQSLLANSKPPAIEVAVDLILSSMSAPWASAADSRPAARETAVPLKLVCLVRRDLGMGVVRSHTRTTLQAHITANAQLRMRGVYYCFDRCDSLSATCARAKLPLR